MSKASHPATCPAQAGRRLVLFLLSPRLIDFDTYLPTAMALKRERPDWDIRFVNFDPNNQQVIEANHTLMAGLAQCATLTYLGGRPRSGGGGALTRLRRRLGALFTLVRWVLAGPLLFAGRPFGGGLYALLYLLARLRGGKGYVLARARLPDVGYQDFLLERFQRVAERSNWVERMTGRDADGLICYHDQQDIYLNSLGSFGRWSRLRRFTMGFSTRAAAWESFIAAEVESERERLRAQGHDLTEVYSFFTAKMFSSEQQRHSQAIAVSFRTVLETLLRLRPNALILVRPHPAAMKEAFFLDTIKELNDPRIVVCLAHPDIMLALSRVSFVNAPTNIVFTATQGRFIDCSLYRDEDVAKRGDIPYGRGYGCVWIDAERSDFEARLSAALEDGYWDARPDLTSMRATLTTRQADIAGLLAWMRV